MSDLFTSEEARWYSRTSWTHAYKGHSKALFVADCFGCLTDLSVNGAYCEARVALIAGLRFPKVQRYLREGRGSARTAEMIEAVLDKAHRRDLLLPVVRQGSQPRKEDR